MPEETEQNNFYSGLWSLGFFLIFSTVMLGMSIVILVACNDYIYYQFYEIATDWVSKGFISPDVLPAMEEIDAKVMSVLNYIDWWWAIGFLVFVITFIRNSYYSKREGYFSVFGFISFGIMAMLFMLNFLVDYNNAIHNIFFNVILKNLNLNLTFYNLYLQNFQIVNLFLIVVGLIVNFIPFDIDNFNRRKDQDMGEISP